jgi:hypothetical protein
MKKPADKQAVRTKVLTVGNAVRCPGCGRWRPAGRRFCRTRRCTHSMYTFEGGEG